MADKIKEAKDISSLIETLVPEFVTADYPKMKIFIEKYYEFMESHQVYFEGIAFNEYKLVQEGEDDFSLEPDYWVFEDEINNKLMPNGDPNEFFDPRVLDGAIINHRIQLESDRDTSKDDQLQFQIGEYVYGNTTDAEAVVTGVSGNTIAWIKPTTKTNFIYGEELTGVSSRAWTTFANGVTAGIFSDGSIEGFRTRGPIAATKELKDFADVDTTVEGLIDSSWKKEFYTHVPKQAATDRRKLLKQMKEVYRSKGGEASYDWLFKAIFNSQDIDYYYPKNDMMRLSDGKWTKDKTVKVKTDTANNIALFEGKEIRGHTSNATAIVEQTITKTVGMTQITELYLSNIVEGTGGDGITGLFRKYEGVETEPDDNNETALGFCSGIISDVVISYGGSNYEIGDRIQFISGGGAEARGEVTALVDDILKGFRIVDAGDGYCVGDKLDFIDGGTGGEGAAATVGTIVPTGKLLKNSNIIKDVEQLAINSNNVNKPLFANSSHTFTAEIKDESGAVWGAAGSFFTSQFFNVGDLIKRQKRIDSTEVYPEGPGKGITLTQSGTTVTLSSPLENDEVLAIIGGKLTYANGNNTIIAGQGNTTTLYTKDIHTIGSGQDFNIYYGDEDPWAPSATVVAANSDILVYTLNSVHVDDLGKQTITNFSNNDTLILYDTSKGVLGDALNANSSDAAFTHTGFVFDVGNTPESVSGWSVTLGDAFATGGGYLVNQTNTTYNVTPILTYTEHDFGSINTLAITNGGSGYQRLPIITVANTFLTSMGNSGEHTGDPNSILNVNLHSYSTGTITQIGNEITLSGGYFPVGTITTANGVGSSENNLLHITYANGVQNYITNVSSNTIVTVADTPDSDISTPESYTLTYMATANTFAAHDLIYNDDYSARARVLDFIDEPAVNTFPRSIGKSYEGSYVERAGQTNYMRRNILNGNTSLRVDMLTTQEFSGESSFISAEGPPDAYGDHHRIVLEDFSGIFPEDSVTFMHTEAGEIIINEDGSYIFAEDSGSDRITAFDGLSTITYSTGTITQSGNVITGVAAVFPNEIPYSTFYYANNLTTTVVAHTNSTSIIVDSSRTISSAETFHINYNPAAYHGETVGITAVSHQANSTVTVTENGHTKTNSDRVKIEGSGQHVFNGIFDVLPIDSNTYNYMLPEETSLQPTGAITSKLVKTSYLDTANAAMADTSLKGNNAVVEVTSVAAGSIKAIDITNVGAGYSSAPRVLATDGDNNAQIQAIVGAFAQYPGEYKGTQGRLNDAPKIQDSRYYQSFSYVLKAPIDTTKYRAHVDRMVHPAGMKMFGELAVYLKTSAELFKSGVHAGSDGLPKDVDDYDDSGYELGRPLYEQLHTRRYHPIIIINQPPNLPAQITTYRQPEIEVYTHDTPYHAMDGRIVHRGNVNLVREDFRDVESMTRSSGTQLSFIMNAVGSNGDQFEIGEEVFQGTSWFTRIRKAEVAGYNHDTLALSLINMDPVGDFDLNMDIRGYISGAEYPILEETTRPMGDIEEIGHSMQIGDEVQITRAGGSTADFWNGSYIIQTVPDANTYQVFLSRYGKGGDPYGDPGENAAATAQTAYGGAYLKVETKAVANVWRMSAQDYGSPFHGDILHEDHVIEGVTYNFKTLLEEGDTYLLPMVEFPEAESGTVTIDMSFSSDLMLEDHINPDTAMHETGYVLAENHGTMGTGPQRYVALEDDTEGIQWSHERGHLGHETMSIPYMETTEVITVYENFGDNLQLEDGSHIIEEGDETSRPLSRFMTEGSLPGHRSTEYEHGKRPVGEIEFEIKQYRGWNFLLEDDETSWIANEEEDPFTGKVYKLQTEEGYFKSLAGTAGDEHRYEFDLYENIGDNLRLEDDSHMIEEGDEASNLSRFLISETSEKHFKTPVGEIEFDLYENAGQSLRLEDGSHLIEEGDPTTDLSRFRTEDGIHVKDNFGVIEFELVPDNTRSSISQHEEQVEVHLVADRSYFNWHLMTEDDDNIVFEETAANQWELGTKLAVEQNYLRTFQFPGTEWMLDKTAYLADNPMRVYKIHHAMNQTAGGEWMQRQIGVQAFGCQVGRCRGAREKYLDGVNHTGDPLQRGSLGKFGEDRTLDGDAYRQNYGEAGSIPSGPGLNMNHPGRIGLFNQYWELMSIHHPIMLTGPAWWKKFELPTTAVTSTPIITHSLTANTQVEQFFSEVVNEKPPGRKVQDGFFELETFTTDTGTGYFVLEEFRSTGDGRTGRIYTDYDISIKGASSSFTTFSSPTGQITMAAGSTTLNGSDTLFQSELSSGDIIQTFSEHVLVEDDDGIVMESDERIEHETITIDGLVEYAGVDELSFHWNTPMERIRWYIATEETQGQWGNYYPGTGYDQETKEDTPGSYYLCGEASNYEQEIELEINTPDPGGVGNKVVASETTYEQQNLVLEDGWKLLLTNQAEFRVDTITNDTTATVTRGSIDGTGSVPFWKQSIETEVIASVSGLHY